METYPPLSDGNTPPTTVYCEDHYDNSTEFVVEPHKYVNRVSTPSLLPLF